MTQLQRISDGVLFDVLGTKTHMGGRNPAGDVVWLQRVGSPHGPFGHGNEHLRNDFTAYPPQEKPDRVDRLAQETDGWVPLQAYQTTFCPVDDTSLEPHHRVVEAFSGARVDAGKCLTCGRFFADDTLTEIKLWKD